MPAAPSALLDGRVLVLALDRFDDDRGSLRPIAFDEIGFRVVGAFVVNAPSGAVRGGHGHRTVRQVLLRASGSIEVELRHGGRIEHVTLDDASPALLVEPGVWARQTYLDDAALVVFADGPYDADEYLHEPELPGGAS